MTPEEQQLYEAIQNASQPSQPSQAEPVQTVGVDAFGQPLFAFSEPSTPGRPVAEERALGSRKYQVQEIQDKHREIMRRLVLGQKGVDIARDLGISAVVVSYVKNSVICAQKREHLQHLADMDAVDCVKRIHELAPQMLSTLEEIAADETAPTNVRAKVAMDLLDRAGYGAVQRSQNITLTGQLTPDDIAELKRRAAESNLLEEAPEPTSVAIEA